QALLSVAALVIIGAGIKASVDLLVPFLLSIFIATIAVSPVFWLERRRLPSALAIGLVMVAIILVLVAIAALIFQSGTAFTNRLPFYQLRIAELMADLAAWLQPFGLEINTDLALSYFNPATALVLAGNLLRGLGSVLGNSFFILLTVIFILAEASSFPRKLRDILSNPERDLPYFTQFAENVNRYIAIKTTTSLATGILVSITLVLLGVDFPILWGLLAFLLNYVPTIGSIIAAVPAVLLALIQLGPGPALIATGGYVVINIGMGNVIEPRFMSRGLGLSTLVVFISLVVWGWLLGPIGMFLSVPLTMTAKIALQANPTSAWMAHLLGPAEGQPPEDRNEAIDETRQSG
ncbi:MAG: AI-2E family transporter, partial [Pseudomonadales bacterium]